MREPPGPRGYPIVGILPRIWKDPLAFFSAVAEECGPLAKMGLGKFTLYLLSDPALIEEVMQDDGGRFWKGKGLAAAHEVMGQGLATSEGEPWQRTRKVLGPAFQPARLSGLVERIAAETEAMLREWTPGRELDVAEATNYLTQRVIFRLMFGSDLAPEEAERLGPAVVEANAWIAHAAFKWLPLPDGFPTPRRRRFERAMQDLDRAIYRVIGERRKVPAEKDDLLGRLLAARDEQGNGLDDRQVRDEVMTQFVAGHETSSNSLAWTLHLLSTNPAACDQVVADIQSVLGGRAPVAEDLSRLVLLERALQESMRIFPPAWVIVRTPYKEEQLGGFDLPAGAPLLISQWVVHRSPRLWPDPLRFDLDRWTPERVAERPRYAYFPFGGGRRICIGNHFAMLLLKVVLSLLLPRFRFVPVPGHPIVPQPTTTLRPKHGVRVRLEAR